MMFWYGGHWAFWQASLMWFGLIVFWSLLIAGVYALVVTATRKPGHGPDRGEARRILDERLARGEISPEEYRRLVDLISAGPGRTPEHTSTRS